MDPHDEGGKFLKSDSSKIIQSSSPNEKKDIGTKHSLDNANLPSSIITAEGQSILILMML